MASSSPQLRLMSDLRAIKDEAPEGCSASPLSDENLFVWSATILGLDETPWEDIVQDALSPCHNVCTILTSIQSLLTDPNLAIPVNPEAAQLFQHDNQAYNERVRRCALRSIVAVSHQETFKMIKALSLLISGSFWTSVILATLCKSRRNYWPREFVTFLCSQPVFSDINHNSCCFLDELY